MLPNEKGQPEGRPIPNAVFHDAEEFTAKRYETQAQFAQAMARSVFGRNYVVVHAPIVTWPRTKVSGDITPFDGIPSDTGRPSRIRVWRAS